MWKLKLNKMKTMILYSASVIVSLFWLFRFQHTFNPITVKGPEFLKFYLMILIGFYLSVLLSKFLKIYQRNMVFCFLVSIMLLGIAKLIRGLYLGKPVGYLMIILIIEVIVILIFKFNDFNRKLK